MQASRPLWNHLASHICKPSHAVLPHIVEVIAKNSIYRDAFQFSILHHKRGLKRLTRVSSYTLNVDSVSRKAITLGTGQCTRSRWHLQSTVHLSAILCTRCCCIQDCHLDCWVAVQSHIWKFGVNFVNAQDYSFMMKAFYLHAKKLSPKCQGLTGISPQMFPLTTANQKHSMRRGRNTDPPLRSTVQYKSQAHKNFGPSGQSPLKNCTWWDIRPFPRSLYKLTQLSLQMDIQCHYCWNWSRQSHWAFIHNSQRSRIYASATVALRG